MLQCPKCGFSTLRRSRTQTIWERLFKACSAKRPFRCRACDWRGWLVDIVPFSEIPAHLGPGESVRREPLDLDSLTNERLRELKHAHDAPRR